MTAQPRFLNWKVVAVLVQVSQVQSPLSTVIFLQVLTYFR